MIRVYENRDVVSISLKNFAHTSRADYRRPEPEVLPLENYPSVVLGHEHGALSSVFHMVAGNSLVAPGVRIVQPGSAVPPLTLAVMMVGHVAYSTRHVAGGALSVESNPLRPPPRCSVFPKRDNHAITKAP